jgi:ATP-dependent Clp protease ATP-binding subunit ClpC
MNPNKPTHRALQEYGHDLTDKARRGELDPVVGREEEIRRVIQVLLRRTKTSVILIGEPGVGKTAIVGGLAQRIVNGDVPEALKNKRLVALDLPAIVSGLKYRGDFEERVMAVLSEIAESEGNIILFIDQFHNVIGPGAAATGMDAFNMLKPMLARGELHCVGATRLSEYRNNIEKDAALEHLFQPVMVAESTVEDTIGILRGLREHYEVHYSIRIRDTAIVTAAVLSHRYICDCFLPDKAIDLVDEVASRLRIEFRPTISQDRERIPKEEVGEEDIAETLSHRTGVPVNNLLEGEVQKLLKLQHRIHQRVVGQDEALNAAVNAIRRARAGLQDPKRPLGSFIFLGPTGVGRTELARALAEFLFDDERAIIRMDMSEYMEKHAVSRLIGPPPGYVGYDEGGQLTEAVRRRPYSVTLFDQVEKAHVDVLDTILEILEKGRLTDRHGRTIDFRNTVVIMTSNLGGQWFNELGPDHGDEIRRHVMDELRAQLGPVFLSAVDEVLIFHSLTRDQIMQILDIQIRSLRQRLENRHMAVELTEAVKEFLVSQGFDPNYGVRPLMRTMKRHILDPLAFKVLDGTFKDGDRVIVDANDDGIVLHKAR